MNDDKRSPLQQNLYRIIFGTNTTAGKWFDIILILVILTSVGIIIADSMPEYHARYGALFYRIEWGFTILFTLEYALRIWIAESRRGYLKSIYGIIDLLSILPTYLALLIPQTAPLLIIRLLRVLRVFRVLKLLAFLDEANSVAGAFRRSFHSIFVFFCMVITIMVVFGCLIYVLEGPDNGFENIPVSIYWAIVTITTVGYGDVVPVTAAGRAVSAMGMLVGYAIIAVPTGIFTSNLVQQARKRMIHLNCPQCARAGHEQDARHCKYCGAHLERAEEKIRDPMD
jgi:voltage-gated potassium channel